MTGQQFEKWISFLASFMVLSSCSEVERTAPLDRSANSSELAAPVQTKQVPQDRRRANIHLGDDPYELDIVVCIGTSTATVTASDSQDRPDYPVVMIRAYDPATSGGYSINTASAVFEREGYAEHWKLHEGTVQKKDGVFTASGTLKGNRLETQSDGTRKSAPFAGKDILPFEAHIEC